MKFEMPIYAVMMDYNQQKCDLFDNIHFFFLFILIFSIKTQMTCFAMVQLFGSTPLIYSTGETKLTNWM